MKRLLIVADDLTGAADSAVGFSTRADCQVLLDINAPVPAATVLAVDLDSRRLDAAGAARAHRHILTRPALAGLPLYKKIDSTLRGHYAVELAALKPRGMALVAPAYPALGRTTRGGIQYLNDWPVHQSETWRNEGLQGTADLREALSAEGLKCGYLSRAFLQDADALQQRLLAALDSGLDALVCDAEDDHDLATLAQASAGLWPRLYWVGSAGLAKALAPLLESAAPMPAIQPQGPLLAVIGSMSSHSHRQAERLIDASGARQLQLDPQALLDRHPGLITESSAGEDLVVRLDQRQRATGQAQALTQALATVLQPTLAHAGTLIATGGETARALLDAAGITHLHLHGEPVPGLVQASAPFQDRTLTVVTKAGAFGQPNALLDAWHHLNLCPAPTTEECPHV